MVLKYNISRADAEDMLPLTRHMGARFDYNMKCYSKTAMPDKADAFLKEGDDIVDCVGDTLWWMHSDASQPRAWSNQGNPLASKNSRGINPECYTLRQKDLVSATGVRRVMPVYPLLQDLTVGTPAQQDGVILSENLAPLFRSIRTNDFFQQDYNDPSNGLLAAELWVPDAPTDLDADMVKKFELKDVVSRALSPRTTENFWATVSGESYPCITLEDAANANRLVQCPPNPEQPNFLDRQYCNSTFVKITAAIRQYAKKIDSGGAPFPSTRYPPASTGYVCLWDCGYEGGGEASKSPVHLGLDTNDLGELAKMAKDTLASCYSHADMVDGQIGRMCYNEPPTVMQDAMEDAMAIMMDDLEGTYTQEVCGELITEADKAFLDIKGGAAGAVIIGFFVGGPVGAIVAGIAAGAAIGGVQNSGRGEGIDSTMQSEFRQYKEINYGRPYNCSRVQVQSSGSEVVDNVRSGLSFNDIKVRGAHTHTHTACLNFWMCASCTNCDVRVQ